MAPTQNEELEVLCADVDDEASVPGDSELGYVVDVFWPRWVRRSEKGLGKQSGQ